MKLRETYRLKDTLTVACGMLLLIAIGFAINNLFKTYIQLEQTRGESFWSIVQLQKELDAMYFQSQLYQVNALPYDDYYLRYELLWSRLPVLEHVMVEDPILNQIPGLEGDIASIFEHVKTVETQMADPNLLSPEVLSEWMKTLTLDKQRLGTYIVQNMHGVDGDYIALTYKQLLSSLFVIALLVIGFMLYLGFLLYSLLMQQKRNHFLLEHDSLTGLKSRHYIMTEIAQYISKRIPFTLINFDLNKFKQINDNYGHHVGDRVLIHLADQFRQTIGTQGAVGRIGGDEFLWVTEIVDPREVNRLHDLLLQTLDEPVLIENRTIYLKTSTGAGLATDHNFQQTSLMEEVDKAMYCAKQLNMARICWDSSLPIPDRRKPQALQKESATPQNDKKSTKKRPINRQITLMIT